MTTEQDVPRCPYPAPRRHALHPPPEYFDLQDHQPIQRLRLPSGLEGVVVTRHDHVRRLLEDPSLSADERVPGYPFLYEDAFETPLAGTFAHSDGERHHRVRRVLGREFSRRRVEQTRPLVQRHADQALDAMAAATTPVDLVASFAKPVPSAAIFGYLGVPEADRSVIEGNTRTMMDATSSEEQVARCAEAIVSHLDEVVGTLEEAPREGLLSRLVQEQMVPGHLEREEIVSIAMIVLISGSETTATMIGLGTFALLQHPEQLERLRRDPSLWPNAVDELLRHQTIITNPIQRVATRDLEVDGARIEAGEGVVMVVEAANRDPRRYTDPHRLDVGREARDHLTFSHGTHTCIASSFARMELEVAFRSLFDRFPHLRLAVPADEVPVRPPSVGMYGVEELLVTW